MSPLRVPIRILRRGSGCIPGGCPGLQNHGGAQVPGRFDSDALPPPLQTSTVIFGRPRRCAPPLRSRTACGPCYFAEQAVRRTVCRSVRFRCAPAKANRAAARLALLCARAQRSLGELGGEASRRAQRGTRIRRLHHATVRSARKMIPTSSPRSEVLQPDSSSPPFTLSENSRSA